MVARTENRRNRSSLLAGVVLVKVFHRSVLFWTSNAVQVVHVAHGLEVTAAQKQVHLLTTFLLPVSDGGINHVKVAMAAAIHCHLHVQRTMLARAIRALQHALVVVGLGSPL